MVHKIPCKNLDLKHFGSMRSGVEAVYRYVNMADVTKKDIVIHVRAKIWKNNH